MVQAALYLGPNDPQNQIALKILEVNKYGIFANSGMLHGITRAGFTLWPEINETIRQNN
jgi:hypothetical protein